MLLKLINDILDISQLEAESLQFNKQSIDVVELCNQLLISSKAKGNSENEFELQTNETRLMMEIDINHFQQVLLNLLSNADKFTEKGTIKLQIIAESDEVKFMVKDTGCGISSEVGAHIFEKFYQGDTSHASEGNGLGLALVKKVIDILGGVLVAELGLFLAKKLGAGRIFTFLERKKGVEV